MSLCETLAAELRQEAKTTRRVLERVPEASFGWKPHEKSMTLGRLAAHVAELPELIVPALTREELDFAAGDFKPFNPTTTAELLEKFDRNIDAVAELLKGQPDERMGEKWRLRNGDHVLFEMPRAAVVRFVGLNHVVHHRGQLSVYLRLLDVPLPSIYGPSADEGPGA
ncbi:MAG TPA: DinB family protein [Pyrinomonadaceae bacterium]